MMQWSTSLNRERDGSLSPSRSTSGGGDGEAQQEEDEDAPRACSPSRSDAYTIVRISVPWLECHPVRSTYPTAAPPGGCIARGCDPAVACSSFVPPRTTLAGGGRCSVMLVGAAARRIDRLFELRRRLTGQRRLVRHHRAVEEEDVGGTQRVDERRR